MRRRVTKVEVLPWMKCERMDTGSLEARDVSFVIDFVPQHWIKRWPVCQKAAWNLLHSLRIVWWIIFVLGLSMREERKKGSKEVWSTLQLPCLKSSSPGNIILFRNRLLHKLFVEEGLYTSYSAIKGLTLWVRDISWRKLCPTLALFRSYLHW